MQLSGAEDLLSVLARVWFLIVRPPDCASCLSIQLKGENDCPQTKSLLEHRKEALILVWKEGATKQCPVAFVLCWMLGRVR